MSISLPDRHLYQATAFNINYFDLNEADRVFTLFTQEFGIIRAIAKGVRKTSSHFAGRMELLRCNHLVIRKGRGLHTIVQCDTRYHFPKLTTDYERLLHALFMGELIAVLCQEHDPIPQLFDRLITVMKILEDCPYPLVPLIHFEFQLLEIMGYQQSFEQCHICSRIWKSQGAVYFDLLYGGIVCTSCKQGYHYQYLSHQAIAGFQSFLTGLPSEISPELLNSMQKILLKYLQNIAEKKLKTADFLPWGSEETQVLTVR